MLKEMLNHVREKCPLIHNITNYVTVNDCANILLACGGSPIMADDAEEAEEITAICGGLNINIGTLNQRTIPAMHLAGKKANELGHPVVLDPVGAGASKLRTNTAKALLEDIHFTVLRGNISEIKTLALGTGGAKGVDADIADKVMKENLPQTVAFAKKFARETGAVIAITGCQLSAMTAAYVTANPEAPLEATAAAVCAMGICGEKAYARLTEQDGNSSYRNYIIDAICKLTGEELESCAKYEIL